MQDILSRLSGPTGRGQYQVDSLQEAMARGIERYRQDKSLYGFMMPLFADVGTGKTPATLAYLYLVRRFLLEQEDWRGELPVLIVCPASVKYNWLDEARRWRTDLGLTDCMIIHGTREIRERQLMLVQLLKPMLVITNYDTIRIHQQWFQNLDPSGQNPFFLTIVADEAHYIKWRSSQRSSAVGSITAYFHVGLTGTAMTNKPDSLWNVVTWLANPRIFHREVAEVPPKPNRYCQLTGWRRNQVDWSPRGCYRCELWMPRKHTCSLYDKGKVKHKCYSDPEPAHTMRHRYSSEFWGQEQSFTYRYCEMEYSQYGARAVGANHYRMPELNDRLRRFGMVRWRRAEVLKLEPIIYEHVRLQATPEQVTIYNQLRNGFVSMWGEEGEFQGYKKLRSILAQITYFRRCVTLTPREFGLALQGRKPEFAPDLKIPISDSGAKQDWLLEFTESELDQDGCKFLIFSEWTGFLHPMIKRLERALKFDLLEWRGNGMVAAGHTKNPHGYLAIIDGDTPQKARQAISLAWNSDPTFKIILGSGAAFEGINLQGGLGPEDTIYAIVVNMPWMPMQVIQAIGRAWRFGQDAQVVALFPSVRGSIDERMTSTLLDKQAAFDVAIDGGEQAMAGLFDVKGSRSALALIGPGLEEGG